MDFYLHVPQWGPKGWNFIIETRSLLKSLQCTTVFPCNVAVIGISNSSDWSGFHYSLLWSLNLYNLKLNIYHGAKLGVNHKLAHSGPLHGYQVRHRDGKLRRNVGSISVENQRHKVNISRLSGLQQTTYSPAREKGPSTAMEQEERVRFDSLVVPIKRVV